MIFNAIAVAGHATGIGVRNNQRHSHGSNQIANGDGFIELAVAGELDQQHFQVGNGFPFTQHDFAVGCGLNLGDLRPQRAEYFTGGGR